MADAGNRNDAPNWETLTVELRCPRCGYDLHLLPQPRCPECGLEFCWDELIAAAQQRLESPLFEYHWRDRPVRSFLATVARAFVPWRLWRETRLVLEPHVGPLLVLIVLLLTIAVICWLGVDYGQFWVTRRAYASLRGRPWPYGFWTFLAPQRYAWVALSYLSTALLSWLFLQIFRQTILRRRIRQSQLLRVVVLSWVAFATWRMLIEVSLAAWNTVTQPTWSWMLRYSSWMDTLGESLALGIFALGLCIGLNRYLEVRRGWLLGLASLFVPALAVVTFLIVTTARWFGLYPNVCSEVVEQLWPGLLRWGARMLGV